MTLRVSETGLAAGPGEMTLTIVDRDELAEGVCRLTLGANGNQLPAWEPGAHIEVQLPSGLVRHYSLCGSPGDLARYQIAVLEDPAGRGGSRELHATARVGTSLVVRERRNRFVLEDASSYLFLARGIGITPILPMISAADQSGRPWRLVYGGRSLASMAFRDELAAYGPDHVTLVPEDLSGWPDLEGEIQRSAEGVAVYACGPAGFLNAVTDIGDRLLPAGSVHLERFVANDTLPQLSAAATTGPIEVELRRRDAVLVVTPGETILEAVRRVDPDVPYSCEEGYCGSCEQRVLGGIPLHRDSVLSEEEAATNESMMLCVGWSLTPRLVLDL